MVLLCDCAGRKGCQVSCGDSHLTVHTISLLCQGGNLPEVTTLPAERSDVFSERRETGNLLLYQCRNLSPPTPLQLLAHLCGVEKVKGSFRHGGVCVHSSLPEMELILHHICFSKMAIMALQCIPPMAYTGVQLVVSLLKMVSVKPGPQYEISPQ